MLLAIARTRQHEGEFHDLWAVVKPSMDLAAGRFWTTQKRSGISVSSFVFSHMDLLSLFACERDLKIVAAANEDYASCVEEVRACLGAAHVCKLLFFAATDIVGYTTFVECISEAADTVLQDGATTEAVEDFLDCGPQNITAPGSNPNGAARLSNSITSLAKI